jgi:Xaa-Pro aminopeptidase
MESLRIRCLRKAASIVSDVMNEMILLVQPGMTEKQVERMVRKLLKKRGADGHSFRIIVASGTRSSIPHGYATKKKIRKNEIVMLDFGGVYKGWKSDITRTINLGRFTPFEQKVYNLILKAQSKAIKAVKAGIPVRRIDDIVRKEFKKHGLEKHFLHSTGHGIGRKVHEKPKISVKSDEVLKEGMIVTVEPGLYFKKWGGIRIEDMVLVKKNGHEVLTHAIR